ncbi:MAG: hypothetical protein AB8C95_09035 [Phycisphaeraceae bacterium]
MELLLLFAFVICALTAGLFLLISFFLVPWARERFGYWALAMFPVSTFAGAFFGWAILLMFVKAMEA